MGITNKDVLKTVLKVPQLEEQLDSIVTDTTNKFSGVETKKADKVALEVERKRIDSFTTLSQGSTTGDAELIDGRVGASGKSYNNIGMAIREQVSLMNIQKNNNGFDSTKILKDKRLITWETPNNINHVYDGVGSYTSPILEVEEGKQYCFTSNKTIITLPNVITEFGYGANGLQVATITTINKLYKIPVGVKFIRFTANTKFPDDLCFKLFSEDMSLDFEEYNKIYSERFESIEKNVENLQNDNNDIKSRLSKNEVDNIMIKSILNKDNLNTQLVNIGDYVCDFSNLKEVKNGMYVSSDSFIKKYSDSSAKIMIPKGSSPNIEVKMKKDINIKIDSGDVLCVLFYVDWDSFDSNMENIVSPLNSIRVYYTKTDGTEVENKLYCSDFVRGWQMIKIPFASDTNLTSVSIYSQSNIKNSNTSDVIVYFDSIFKNYKMKPCILLNFDNMTDSNLYNIVYPLLESFGFKGTFYLGSKNALGGNYISKKHFDEMIDNGWDYAFYGSSGSTYGYNSDYLTAYNYVKDVVDFRKKEGIPLPISWFCQNGQTSNTFSRVLKDLGFKIIRGTGQTCINYFGEDGFETKFNSLDATETSNKLELIKGYVDTSIKTGSALSVFTHQLLTNADNTGINSTVAVWTEFLSYLKQKVDSGLIDVLTYKEFYERCVRTSVVAKQGNLRNQYRIKSIEDSL